jgi:FkbM family methyltransferase
MTTGGVRSCEHLDDRSRVALGVRAPSHATVLARKLRWRAHWLLDPRHPMRIRHWWGDITLIAPRSGSAATAYYRTFPSPAIAQWLGDVLRPGMTMIDIGAHVGVYSLVAARLVAPGGTVHAVEPQDDCARYVEENAAVNGFDHVHVHRQAIGDLDGTIGLISDQRTMGGMISETGNNGSQTSIETFEAFMVRNEIGSVDLLKIDAAGNEGAVISGSTHDGLSGVRTVICKLYHPDVVESRFRDAPSAISIVEMLQDAGFHVILPDGEPADAHALRAAYSRDEYCVAAFAVRP